MRILVVDDDKLIRNLLSSVLCRFGSVDDAGNGRDAVLKFIRASTEGKPYQLVFMDFEMPVMNGHEALQMIRLYEQDHPDPNHVVTTVLITSGNNECETIFGDMLSIDPHLHLLSKPLDLRWLHQFLVSFLKPGRASEPHASRI